MQMWHKKRARPTLLFPFRHRLKRKEWLSIGAASMSVYPLRRAVASILYMPKQILGTARASFASQIAGSGF